MKEMLGALRECPEAWPIAAQWSLPGGSETLKEGDPVAELADVCFRYSDGILAIDNANLRIRKGEVLALLGPNGAGKTTLAQIIAGILRPQKGLVRIRGADPATLVEPPLKRPCSFVFQNPEHQFVTDRVYDEVAFGLRKISTSVEEIRKQVESLLNRFGLLEKRNSNPFELSHGQKRRLSVATMLVSETPLLVLDEPTFGQDPRNVKELLRELRRLNREGLTLVLVTHDMQLVWELANRAAILHNGRIQCVGPVSEMFRNKELLEQAHLVPPPRARIAEAMLEATG